MRLRTFGIIMSALIETGALSADLAGFEVYGSNLPFAAIALVAFIVFAAIVTWQIWILNNELHTDQKQLAITVMPSHLKGTPSLPATFFNHTDGTSLVAVGFLTITTRNAANYEIRIGEMFVEAYRRSFFRQLEVARLLFVAWGDNHQWYDEPHRDRVEWLLPPQSPATNIDVQYQDNIFGGVGKKWRLRLVATIGKNNRRIVVPFWPN